MYTCQRDFPEAGHGSAFHLPQHRIDRQTLRRAARRRNDAIRAGLGAARLYPERERGAARDARLDRRAAASVSVSETFGGCGRSRRWSAPGQGGLHACGRPSQDGNESRLLIIRDDAQDVRQLADLVGPTCGIAARDNDTRGGVGAGHTADGLARALISRGRHRTRVHDDEIGLLGRRGGRAVRAKLFLEAERVGLVDPAAERHDRVLHRHRVYPVRAFRPMSRRYCIPPNEISATPVYARAIASEKSAPRPTTVRTRPPAVTSPPSRTAVPA